MNSGGLLLQGLEPFADPLKWEEVRHQFLQPNFRRSHRLCGSPYSLNVDRFVPFMCIDHVDPSPIPFLHVDRSRSILMITGNHQSPSRSGQITGQIQCLLCTSRLQSPPYKCFRPSRCEPLHKKWPDSRARTLGERPFSPPDAKPTAT